LFLLKVGNNLRRPTLGDTAKLLKSLKCLSEGEGLSSFDVVLQDVIRVINATAAAAPAAKQQKVNNSAKGYMNHNGDFVFFDDDDTNINYSQDFSFLQDVSKKIATAKSHSSSSSSTSSVVSMSQGGGGQRQPSKRAKQMFEAATRKDEPNTNMSTTKPSHKFPLSQTSTTTTSVSSKKLTCSVCKETPTEAFAGRCGHVACKLCWSKWMKVRKSCPVCRAEVNQTFRTKVIIKA